MREKARGESSANEGEGRGGVEGETHTQVA